MVLRRIPFHLVGSVDAGDHVGKCGLAYRWRVHEGTPRKWKTNEDGEVGIDRVQLRRHIDGDGVRVGSAYMKWSGAELDR